MFKLSGARHTKSMQHCTTQKMMLKIKGQAKMKNGFPPNPALLSCKFALLRRCQIAETCDWQPQPAVMDKKKSDGAHLPSLDVLSTVAAVPQGVPLTMNG